MRITMNSGGQEEVHWGQCFEEFYGAEYCKNLKKDLEKLKDEFYDGNAHRFQHEWVLPTANLLRRLLHMGFPVRTRDHIVIHLYNPVDSMFAGEMHFQVGRKAPGTLTLKFTKQSTNGMFVIQPKTLSITDEAKLCENPLTFFEKVRAEMQGLVLDPSSLMQVMVLMTETCKLQRQCAKVFFAHPKFEIASGGFQTGHLQENPVPPLPMNSLQYPSNQWAASTLINPEPGSLRAEGNFPFPLNFCVKNYVNCNTKPGVEVINPRMPIPGHQSTVSNGHHVGAGVTYRQARSSTWHSEPEENDETLEVQSYTESNWPRQPADSMEEIQRRMSDARLWEATKVPTAPSTQATDSSANVAPGTSQASFSGAQAANVIETKVWIGEVRTSLTEEYAKDSNVAPVASEVKRKNSDLRTASTAEYFVDSNSASQPDFANGVAVPLSGQGSGDLLGPRRNSTQERTSLTEEYAGDASPGTGSAPTSGIRRKDNLFKDGFADWLATANGNGSTTDPRAIPRTGLVSEYAGDRSGSPLKPLNLQQGRAFSDCNSPAGGSSPGGSSCDGRRTSSLDGYVGSPSVAPVNVGSARVHSDSSLNQSATTVPRTGIVDQYFQEGASCSRVSTTIGRHVGAPDNTSSQDAWTDGREATLNSLDSWMSHSGQPVPQALWGGGPRDAARGSRDETDASLLSHTSYPSWASHPFIPAAPGGRVLIPLAVEEINKNFKTWK